MGWAKANMLYDLASGPPEMGSLLESLFLMLSKRRQEQELLRTRTLVEATLAPHTEGKNRLSETFEDYANAMFPYLKGQKVARDKMNRKILEDWVGQKALTVRPLWRAREGDSFGLRSKLQRGIEGVRKLEADRRSGRMRRIG